MRSNLDEIRFVNKKVSENKYTILSEKIAIGNVYKIPYCGDLNDDGYEIGYLFIPTGSGIKYHIHNNDVERYKLLTGCLSVNGEFMDTNICQLGSGHCIDVVGVPTIIQTIKINKLLLDKIENFSNETFEQMIPDNNESKLK